MSAQWARTLDSGKARIYLLHGDETLLIKEAAAWLRKAVLAGAVEDFNLDRFDGRDAARSARIIEAARTLPMMAARRLVLVSHAESLLAPGGKGRGKARTRKGKAEAGQKDLLAYLADPDPSTCLVLVAEARVKKTLKTYKAIDKVGVIYDAKTPYERELPGWVSQRARGRGRRIESDAAAFLVDLIGRDLTGLDAAVERLSLYVTDEEAPITLNDVEQAVAHTRASTIWELLDAVADRKAGHALACTHELMGQGEAPLKILAMIARQIRQMIIGRGVRATGADARQIAQEAGVPPFRAQAFMRQLERYSGEELLRALDRINAADRALKGSKVSPEVLLEAALIDVCAPRG